MSLSQTQPLFFPRNWNVSFSPDFLVKNQYYFVRDFLPVEFVEQTQEKAHLKGSANQETQPQTFQEKAENSWFHLLVKTFKLDIILKLVNKHLVNSSVCTQQLIHWFYYDSFLIFKYMHGTLLAMWKLGQSEIPPKQSQSSDAKKNNSDLVVFSIYFAQEETLLWIHQNLSRTQIHKLK